MKKVESETALIGGKLYKSFLSVTLVGSKDKDKEARDFLEKVSQIKGGNNIVKKQGDKLTLFVIKEESY